MLAAARSMKVPHIEIIRGQGDSDTELICSAPDSASQYPDKCSILLHFNREIRSNAALCCDADEPDASTGFVCGNTSDFLTC
jgi:hypothetical protein